MADSPSYSGPLEIAVRRDGKLEWSGTLDQADVIVGRSPRSDVVLADPSVSWTHALIRVDRDAGIVVSDKSTNGVFHKGQRVTNVALAHVGHVTIPPFDIELRLLQSSQEAPYTSTLIGAPVPRPSDTDARGPRTEAVMSALGTDASARAALRFVQAPGDLLGMVRPLASSILTIGRAADCDIRLNSRTVSRYHARLTALAGDRWKLQDAGSQNGIEVNGQMVQDADVGFGDRIGIGTEIVALLQRWPAEGAGEPAAAPARASEPSPQTALDSLTLSWAASSIDPTITVMRVIGRVDGYTHQYLRDELTAAIEKGQRLIVADFLKCAYCDHAGLGVLVHAQVTLRQHKGGICLTGLSPQLKDAFILLRLEQILPVAPDEKAAVVLLRRR
jgi:anti-anti-sigma factor